MDRQAAPLLVLGAAVGAAVWLVFKRWQAGRGSTAASPAPEPEPASKGSASKPVGGLDEHQRQQQEAAALAAAAAAAAAQRRRQSPLYRVSQNELMVHEMLLSGQEGGLAFLGPEPPGADSPEAPGQASAASVPPVMAAGRGLVPPAAAAAAGPAASAAPAAPSEQEQQVAELQQQVRETLERAFFNALAEGLRAGQAGRLAALLLDARDQLAALLPLPSHQAAQQQQQQQQQGGSSSGSGGSEGQALLAELQEKLDSSYVLQLLERYDAAYCAQAFDLLVHVITRLQAPARRQHTREQYAQVAALFAAAAAAEAAGAGASAALQSPAAAAAGVSVASPATQVQLRLAYGSGGDEVAIRLAPAAPDADVAGTAAAGLPGAASEDSLPELQWQLSLAPDATSDGVIAVLAPNAAKTAPGKAAGGAAPGADGSSAGGTSSDGCSSSGGGSGSVVGAVSESSIAAVVAAARFMHSQLNELKADVAAARLSMLRGEPTQAWFQPADSSANLC